MTSLSRRTLLAGVASGGAAAALPAASTVAAHGAAVPAGVSPGDDRYDDLVRNWNARFVGSPDVVWVPAESRQVVSAIEAAVSSGRRVAVRSGGHCLEGFVGNDDVKVLVDLSQLDRVEFDPHRRAIMIEPGATLRRVYEVLFKRWDVTLPAGGCPSVGAGGHFIGGGYGALARRLGVVPDYLYAVEVVSVDADGRVRTRVATRRADDPHRDLWWAHTGGGGGNFGVVTKFWLRTPGATGSDPCDLLPRPPRKTHLRQLGWDRASLGREGFTTLVQRFTGWYATHSAPDSRYTRLNADLWLLHKSCAAGPSLNIEVDPTEDDAEQLYADFHRAVVAPVGNAPETLSDRVMPWWESTRVLSYPDTGDAVGRRSKDRAAYLRTGFTDAQLAVAHDYLNRDDYSAVLAGMLLTGYGGRVNAVASDATALPQRDSVLKVQHSAYWDDARQDDAQLAWVREFYRDFYADSGGVPELDGATDGSYINYPDVDLADPHWNGSGIGWQRLYYKGNYERLQRVKARYDPLDVFRHELSVELPRR